MEVLKLEMEKNSDQTEASEVKWRCMSADACGDTVLIACVNSTPESSVLNRQAMDV